MLICSMFRQYSLSIMDRISSSYASTKVSYNARKKNYSELTKKKLTPKYFCAPVMQQHLVSILCAFRPLIPLIVVYTLYFSPKIPTSMYIHIGVGERRRILDIQNIVSELGVDFCATLPALHSFTGNGYTSAFHGMGKKAFSVTSEV